MQKAQWWPVRDSRRQDSAVVSRLWEQLQESKEASASKEEVQRDGCFRTAKCSGIRKRGRESPPSGGGKTRQQPGAGKRAGNDPAASSKEQKGSRSWRSSRAPGVTVEVWNVCPFVPEGKKKEAAPKRNLVKSR